MEDFRNNNNSSDKKTHFSHKPRGEKFERSGGRERNDFHKFGRKPFHHNDNRNHEYRNKDVTSAENNSFRTEKREKEQNFERRPFVRREGGFKPRGEKFERSGSRERNDFNSRNFSNNRNNEFKSRKFDIHHEHPLDPNKDLSKLRQIVIEIIEKENNRPLPINVLTSILIKQYKDQIGYINGNEVNHVVDTLLSEKKIFQTRGNSLVNDLTKVENKNSFNNFNVSDFKIPGKGFLNINNSGNGFISLNNKDKAHYYVNKEDLNNAQNGDFVEFLATESSQDLKHLTSAIIKSVIEHAKDMYVGEIVIGCDRNEVKLDDMKSNLNIILENYDGLVNGTKILLKINKYEQNNAYASILRIIGHKDDVGVDIESIVYDNGVEIDFSQDSLEYASKITVNIDEYQRKIRTDLTSKPIVTIDPSTSKDFDDAFYCEKLNDEKYLLAVQIADPTHYIKYQSVLDKESALRGCSVYLVDRVIPMVPHNLSDDICSLNPNEERLTLSCDMIVDKEGNISDIKVFPSIIKSKRRFTYDEVNDYIEKKADFSKEDSEVKKSIDIGLEISEALYKNKKIRGYINFEIPKAVIKVDEKGEVIEITKEVHKLAQRMIEDFAVAANESVTIYAQKKNYPFIYRIHEKPEEKRLKIFSIEAKKMNFKITTDLKDIQPNDISKWLIDNTNNKNLPLINMFLLRSMSKAKYSVENAGHFGLASVNYTHFTSPIRRYPDDVVHRIFWMWEFDKENFSDEQRNTFISQLSQLCELSSKAELRSIKCERDVDAMKFAQYMSNHLNEQFEGTVVGLTNIGCFVQLENTIEGIIGFRNMNQNDYYSYDESTNEIHGRNTGLVLSFGTKVLIEVISADKFARKIDFRLIKIL